MMYLKLLDGYSVDSDQMSHPVTDLLVCTFCSGIIVYYNGTYSIMVLTVFQLQTKSAVELVLDVCSEDLALNHTLDCLVFQGM